MKIQTRQVSVIIPMYNEAENIKATCDSLGKILGSSGYKYELIFVDDGSKDNSAEIIRSLSRTDKKIKLVKLMRNFGKEIATTAGIQMSHGDAVIMVDADGQHPFDLIPEFLAKWENGSMMTVGIRVSNLREGAIKKYGSKLYYTLSNSGKSTKQVPGSTDFRIIDRSIINSFNSLTEHSRITRHLLEWLYPSFDMIEFNANERTAGVAGYSTKKLIRLAMDGLLSNSSDILRVMLFFGITVTVLSILLGLFTIIESTILGDPLALNVTGSGYLGIGILLLSGVVLTSNGLIAHFISYIYEETRNRPLYVIDYQQSVGFHQNDL